MTSSQHPIVRWSRGVKAEGDTDELAKEEPLEIRVNNFPLSVTMRTPGHDTELAAGFVLSEGVIREKGDIADIRPHPRNEHGNIINIFPAEHVVLDYKKLTRHVFASSSCGLCGKATIEAIQGTSRPVHSTMTVSAQVIAGLALTLRGAQETFNKTGGLHAAGLFTREGVLLVSREDVGRHNAVDKVVGHALLSGSIKLNEVILVVSGRTSFEIVQKALMAGIPMVCAVSAPSSLAVELAEQADLTLVGFLREDRFNTYAGAGRIAF